VEKRRINRNQARFATTVWAWGSEYRRCSSGFCAAARPDPAIRWASGLNISQMMSSESRAGVYAQARDREDALVGIGGRAWPGPRSTARSPPRIWW